MLTLLSRNNRALALFECVGALDELGEAEAIDALVVTARALVDAAARAHGARELKAA